ncbi:type II/IV secretion system ATPase subunit [Methanococcoides seepicolus]|uniref:Type II/IV secretion system ATPase subunit n=1 Tax=Methanococcoides seepicolus TaxID=2828780 RepID=A0A9E4ZJE8_9EURY|nr:type II/IV secretion system ATPase subunit [Methanococcoides seepicolus]MCM1987818.1 type II/IV secretion system ATPase subunit [Methanococcoides seepicolus]
MKEIVANIKNYLSTVDPNLKKPSFSSFFELLDLKKRSLSKGHDVSDSHNLLNEDLVSFTVPEGHKEIEKYWVDEPYSFVSILYDTIRSDTKYVVVEPKLNRFEKTLLEEVIMMLEDVLTLRGVDNIDEFEKVDRSELLRQKTAGILSEYSKLDTRSFEKIFYYVKRDFVEFGKISAIMRDHSVEDIWCNGVGIPIYVYHSGYGDLPTNIVFDTDDELDSFVMRIAQQGGRHLSKSNPILDTVMKEGSRINITYGHDISPKGSSFSIRRQKKVPLTPLDLIAWKTFSAEMMAYFWLCMENRKNILLCGGTATGKTSALNAICMFIPLNIRIVTLEDTREIQLPHENWIPTVTRDGVSSIDAATIDLEDLLRASLRQRPEYLLVGEVRGREAEILFQAMNAGHATCSTFHAGTPKEVINRFTNPPINVPAAMFTALDVICMLSNSYENGAEKRKVSVVAEVTGVGKDVHTKDVFHWDFVADGLNFAGSGVLDDIRRRRGWSAEEVEDILEMRAKFLVKLIERGIRDYDSVVRWINAYCKNPVDTMSLLDGDGSDPMHSILSGNCLLNIDECENEMLVSQGI